MLRSVAPFMEAGEVVQAIFLAQSGTNLPSIGTIAEAWWRVRFRVIVVTDRRIAVFAARRMRLAAARKHLADFPRDTDVSLESGPSDFAITLGGTRYWVDQAYLPDLE